MVFTSCQHQSPLPASPKMDLWCFTGQKNGQMNGKRQEWGGQAEGQDGCLSTESTGSTGQKLQMCGCGRGFGFLVKCVLGARFQTWCVGVSAVLIIIPNFEANSQKQHNQLIALNWPFSISTKQIILYTYLFFQIAHLEWGYNLICFKELKNKHFNTIGKLNQNTDF